MTDWTQEARKLYTDLMTTCERWSDEDAAEDIPVIATALAAAYERGRSEAVEPLPEKERLLAWSSLRLIADAIGELFGPVASLESEEASLLRGPEYHHFADGVVEALQRVSDKLESAQAPIPAGWKLVPLEPTKEIGDVIMWEIAGQFCNEGLISQMYARLLSVAAPTPEAT